MNPRERWLACMNFQPVDHVPDVEFGYWEETFPIWHAKGLPKYIDNIPKADIYFGFEQTDGFPFDGGFKPGFEYKVLSEDDRHVTILDSDGATKVINKDGASSIPHYLKFPIETRSDWEDFKKRLSLDRPFQNAVSRRLRNARQASGKINRSGCHRCWQFVWLAA